jgi:ADP-dependent phosphofructokinase/glucokinase
VEPKADIHLVIEYPEGLKWGKYTAPRYNRFYINHDKVNEELKLLEKVDKKKLRETDIYAVGGLQLF